MPIPTVQQVEDFEVDLNDAEAIVNGNSTVTTRVGGDKLSLSQALSQIIVGNVTVYDSGTTYSNIEDWVEQGGAIYRPLPSQLPIGPEAFNASKWAVVQGVIAAGVPNETSATALIASTDYSSSPANTVVEVLGWAQAGDGGGAKWKKTGVTGLTASQTPAQLGDAKLTDANGHEWQLVGEVVNVLALGANKAGVTDSADVFNAASAGSLAVYVPGYDFRLESTWTVRMGTKIYTDGYKSALLFYGLAASVTDGIDIVVNGSLDVTIIEPLTIRAMDSNGRRGINTPSGSDVFNSDRPRYYLNVFFAPTVITDTSSTYGWDEQIHIGDCRGGKIHHIAYGRYNAQATDVGQAVEKGIVLTSTVGNIGLDIFTNMVRVRRGIEIGDGVEGFFIGSGSEIVGSWEGIICTNSGGEPGGFIDDVHMNVNSRGLKCVNRVNMNIDNIQVNRSGVFFDHGGDFIAVEMDTCTLRMSMSNINISAASPFTGTQKGVVFNNCADISLDTIKPFVTTTAFEFNDTENISADNLLLTDVTNGLDFSGTSNNIRINSWYQRGSVTNLVTFDGAADRDTIHVDKSGILQYLKTLFSAAGTTTFVSGVDAPVQSLVMLAGSGAYIYNFDLEEDGASVGDRFTLKITLPASANPTVNVRRQNGSAILSTFSGGGSKRFICEYIFTGSVFEELWVFESVETSY